MIARSMAIVIIGMAGLAVPGGAQRLPVDDSLGVFAGVSSRLVWRGITLTDAMGLETGASLPLSSAVRGLQLELRGWTALADRDRFSQGDQYSAGLHYQFPVRGAPHPASYVLRFTEYFDPGIDRFSAGTAKHAEEIGAKGILNLGIERLGVRTLRLELDVATLVGRRRGTWMSGSASISAGTTFDRVETVHTVSALLRATPILSDLADLAGETNTGFGFHALDLGLDVEHRLGGPLMSFSPTTTLRLGVIARPGSRGPTIGWLGVRESLLVF